MSFERQPGEATGRLSWSSPAAFAPHGYEVSEGGEVVGETPDRSIAVKVRPGRTYLFAVRSLDPTAQRTGCVNRLRQKVSFQPPAPAVGLAATAVRKRSARLVWSASAAGDARVAGYRVYRDGRPYRQVHGLSLRVSTSAKTHSYRIAGKDVRGNIGEPSTPVGVMQRPLSARPAGTAARDAGHASRQCACRGRRQAAVGPDRRLPDLPRRRSR